jgi:GNAT superfamily N-acetyltransferase
MKEVANIKVPKKVLEEMIKNGLDFEVVQIREDVSFLMDPNWVEMRRTMGKVLAAYSEIDAASRREMMGNKKLLLAKMFEEAGKNEKPEVIKRYLYKLNPSCHIEKYGNEPAAAILLGRYGNWVTINTLYVLPGFRNMQFATTMINRAKKLHSNLLLKYKTKEERKFMEKFGFKPAPKPIKDTLNSKRVLLWEK